MTLGPWYVGDTPQQDISVNLLRDGMTADISGFTSGAVMCFAPDGQTPVTWPGVVAIDGSAVVIPKPASSPFATAGLYPLFVSLSTPGGTTETFYVGLIEVRTTALAWPPMLWELKEDAKLSQDDHTDDDRLQMTLDAACAFYERVKANKLDFTNAPITELPKPTKDNRLGILRLAHRWHVRRRSPQMLASMGDLGDARIPSFDPDIERLLGIGRKRGFLFA
jgi:hypothetical protein